MRILCPAPKALAAARRASHDNTHPYTIRLRHGIAFLLPYLHKTGTACAGHVAIASFSKIRDQSKSSFVVRQSATRNEDRLCLVPLEAHMQSAEGKGAARSRERKSAHPVLQVTRHPSTSPMIQASLARYLRTLLKSRTCATRSGLYEAGWNRRAVPSTSRTAQKRREYGAALRP